MGSSRWVEVSCVVALMMVVQPAFADDAAARTAATKVMLEVQRKAFVASDHKAFAATLAPGAVTSFNGDKPSTDLTLWDGSMIIDGATIAATQIGWAGTWGWVGVEIRIKAVLIAASVEAGARPSTETYHLLELVVPDGAGVKAAAVVLLPTKADKDLGYFDYAAELVPLTSPTPLIALLGSPTALAKALDEDPATSVLGTSANDRGLGAAAAKKLVASWSKLVLQPVTAKDAGDESLYETVEQRIGDATIAWTKVRMKVSGHNHWTVLAGFSIARATPTGPRPVALMYSAH
ncbi:MAG TPA: hypothetical protein VGF94_27900 [Kofleriaceae bacterium]|jgi:hypothetical protein